MKSSYCGAIPLPTGSSGELDAMILSIDNEMNLYVLPDIYSLWNVEQLSFLPILLNIQRLQSQSINFFTLSLYVMEWRHRCFNCFLKNWMDYSNEANRRVSNRSKLSVLNCFPFAPNTLFNCQLLKNFSLLTWMIV